MADPTNPYAGLAGLQGPQQSTNTGGIAGTLGGWFGLGSGDPSNPYRNAVGNTGAQANAFGNASAAGYGSNQAGINNTIGNMGATQGYFQNQMNGGNSVSAMQLQQGLQQNLAAQQANAASASPQNAAMAARNAAMGMGQAASGLAGQQAVAGLQERNQAAQLLSQSQQNQGQLQLGQSGQNMQGALGGYGASNQAYGAALGTPQQTLAPMLGAGIGGAAAALAKSDRRAKTEIEDGDDDAGKAISGLRAFAYKYKDERDGKGKQFGVMAQDLERAGLGHAVIDTPSGKMVHGAKAALSGLALIASLGKRVSSLEGKK